MRPTFQTPRASLRQRMVARVTRLYPLASGAGSFANHRLVRAVAGRRAGATDLARLRGGTRLLVRLDDYVGRAAFFAGDLDPKVTWACDHILRAGDVAIDIGANHGIVTMRLANRVGPDGHVLAFEPNPDLAALLQRSASENGFRHVTVQAAALGDAIGTSELTIPAENSGKASLTSPHLQGQRVRVRVARLDDMLVNVDRPIRLIKLDVEGGEAAVLRGGERTLIERPPQAIVFECNDHQTPIEQQVVPEMLISVGYAIFELPFAWLRPRIGVVDPSLPPSADAHELVAVHRSNDFDEIVRALRL